MMTRTEYLTAKLLLEETGKEHSSAEERFYRGAGLARDILEKMMQGTRGFGRFIGDLPDSYHRIQDGDCLSIEGRDWHVLTGRGHSPEHACLHCPELDILIAGDQVLPKITPNVSVHSREPEANPMAEWLESLDRFRQLPEATLTLPAHNEPFLGLHQRLDFIIDHHEQKMASLLDNCREPKSVVELLPGMFGRELYAADLMFGLGECLAHLNGLIARGQIKRIESDAGVFLYQTDT